jgi:hypothetical protein
MIGEILLLHYWLHLAAPPLVSMIHARFQLKWDEEVVEANLSDDMGGHGHLGKEERAGG